MKRHSVMTFWLAGFLALGTSGCAVEGSEDLDELQSAVTAQVFDFATAEPIEGRATLSREPDGHEMEFDAAGLVPGHVVTLWYVPFDAPENCTAGGQYDGLNACGVPDIGNAATEASMMFAGGGIVDAKGQVVLEDFVGLGAAGAPGEIFRGDGLDNIAGSEVHLVPRTHGPPIDSCFEAQITTFGGCCDLYPCANVHAAIFAP